MPKNRQCSFCGNPIEPGTGKVYIKNNGQVLNFCTNKCKKNLLKLGKKARETEWTQKHAQEKAIRTYTKKETKGDEEGEEKKKILKKKD